MLHESCVMKNQCLYILRYTVRLFYFSSNSICYTHNEHQGFKKSNQQDKLYLLCLWHRYTAPRVCCHKCCNSLCWRTSAKDQLKPSRHDGGLCVCQRGHTEYTMAFVGCTSPLSNITSFSFIFPHLNLHKHVGVHIVIHAICHCMQWQAAVVWGWWEGLC